MNMDDKYGPHVFLLLAVAATTFVLLLLWR